MKKQERPVLLGKTLDTAVQDYILKSRENRFPVNLLVTIAAAKGQVGYPRVGGL